MLPFMPADHLPAPAETTQRCQICAARITCLVGQLPRAQQDRLDPLIRERSFRKGEILQTEGVVPTVVRTIKLGTVVLTREGPDDRPHPIALVSRGHLLGLWGLLGGETQVGAQGLSAGRVCELPTAALRQTLVSDNALFAVVHEHMAQSFARLADWAQVMRLRGLPRQLVAALMLMARDQGSRTVLLPSQVTLAALLSTSRETVARTLRQIEDDGYLRRIDRWHGELTGTHRQVFRGNDTGS